MEPFWLLSLDDETRMTAKTTFEGFFLKRYWFVSKNRQNSKLALITFLLAFLVIILGAYTRLTDAGLSCPDWPNCYGYMTAPHTLTQLQEAAKNFPHAPINVKKAWTEMTHRYFAGTEGILILILAFSIVFNRKMGDTKAVCISIALVALLGIQVMLGMLTVTEKLKPVIVLSHLLTGLSLLSVLWWAYLDLSLSTPPFNKRSNPDIIPWLWIAFIIVSLQITLGGWVSSHYAGLACVDFPYCNGELLPRLNLKNLNTDLITIHMLHRIGAMITAGYLITLGLLLLTHAAYRKISLFILFLIVLQITLGILNVTWLRPVWIGLLHHAIAIMLLLTIILFLEKAYYKSWDYRYGF